MVTIHPKTTSIIVLPKTLWGNKPMIVQLSYHIIKSTTAQTFENAENAEISQGLYVAALKNCTRERGQLPLSPVHSGALRSAQGRAATDPSPVCGDYLKSTKTILSLIAQFSGLGTLLPVHLKSEQVALSMFTSP